MNVVMTNCLVIFFFLIWSDLMSNNTTYENFLYKLKNNSIRFNSIPEHIRENKDFALKAVQINESCYQKLSSELRNDIELAKKCLKSCSPYFLKNLSEDFKRDKDLVMYSVDINPNSIIYASEDLQKNREIAYIAAKNGCNVLNVPFFKDDKEIVSLCLEYNGLGLFDISNRLRDDISVVLIAIEKAEELYVLASQRIKDICVEGSLVGLSPSIALRAYVAKEFSSSLDCELGNGSKISNDKSIKRKI